MPRRRLKKNLDSRIPNKEGTRYMLCIDESGVANFKDKRKEFILTGVILQISDAQNYRWYYETTKKKFTEKIDSLHATTLFSNGYHKSLLTKKSKLFRFPQYKKHFIDEIKILMDTIPFVHITVCINKDKLKKTIPKIQIKNIGSANLNAIEELYYEKNLGFTKTQFLNSTIKENLKLLHSKKVPKENDYYPYKLALEKIVKFYIDFLKLYDSNGEIIFENSPTEITAWELVRKIQNDTDKVTGNITPYAKEFRDRIINISFSAKKARYLGLELADLIAFGYSLRMRGMLTKNKEYNPIWKTIKRRERIVKKELNLISCEEL